MPKVVWRGCVATTLLTALAAYGTPACGIDIGSVDSGSGAVGGKKDGGGNVSGTGAPGGSWPGKGGSGANTGGGGASTGGGGASTGGGGASTGGGGANTGGCGTCPVCGDGKCEGGETLASCPGDCHCGNGQCEPAKSETPQTCASDCHCGDGACNAGETCKTCPGDCPSGGTKDCYSNGLHSNCCSGQNSDKTECEACGNDVGCPSAEYAAYCDRFSPGDNLWQKYHRGWVESQCGGTAQNDGNKYYCTNPSTCTTYECPL